MTASVRWHDGPRRRHGRSRWSVRWRPVALLALSASGLSPPASAQVAASVGIASDYRLRGYSLSAGRPVATADLAYEDPEGIYFNASAVAVLGRGGPALMGLQGNVGYARRLNSRLSIDGGILRSQYFRRFSGGRKAHYTEAYLGLATRGLASRIYVSPDYFQAGVWTLYGELEGVFRPAARWSLTGHAGVLSYLDQPSAFARRPSQYDWRISAAREIGASTIYIALSGGGPGADYYDRRSHGRTAIVVGATHIF